MVAASVLVVGAGVGITLVATRGSTSRSPAIAGQSSAEPASSLAANRDPGSTATSTVDTASDHVTSEAKPTDSVEPPDPIGRVQPVPEHANAQVESVVEALRNHDHPERLSTLIAPAPFDRAKFAADVKGYRDVCEPARVFQSAQPGPAVPVLEAVGASSFTMRQDGDVVLRVRSEPAMPVTFTSFDLGHFSNQLTSQTVVADASGIAAVKFLAGPGTVDAVHILAGSPAATGQVAFDVIVQRADVAAIPHSPANPPLPR